MFKAVRGMHDLFGEEIERWKFAERKVSDVLSAFGYSEIRLPVLERREVFSHTVGDETDIVEKQMYEVAGDESERLVLRPEGTASFIRAVVEHQLHQTGLPQRYYYYLPMFRHERPQKGRLRQFFQFGAELINDASPEADAEIITLLDQIYRALEVSAYEVRINSVGCPECRPVYKEVLKKYFAPQLKDLCEQCQKRFERSPLRILDCKRENCQKLAAGAPTIVNNLCANCRDHHEKTKLRLTQGNVKFIEDPYIVRGLDYYSRTAFEFTSNLLGAQSALGGGGRYDGMSTRFGEKAFPAVGFGLGMERLMIALEATKALPTTKPVPRVFLAPLGGVAFEKLFGLSLSLKRKGVWAEMSYEKDKPFKWQLKHADRLGAQLTLLLGENEIQEKKATLKNMKDGTQETIAWDSIEERILRGTSEI